MSDTWTAKVRPEGGDWINVETQAHTYEQARDILCSQYGLRDNINQIANLQRQGLGWGNPVSSSSGSSDGSWALIGLVCAIGIAWWLLPWVLLGGAGFGSYKLAKNRVSGKNASLILAAIVSTSSIVGFASGTAIKAEYNSQSEVEEVKSLNETN